ncbi:MAG: type II secretion system inner membrane protein GspF [Opitutae bacterium]|nr:type II secretion system inner membrane protein GspF [Opitutae bacterium]
MAKFKYKAIDGTGKQVSGSIEAPNEEQARAKLQQQRLMVSSISEEGFSLGKKGGKKKRQGYNKKISNEQLTIFTRQLATLLQAGLPLLRANQILSAQERDPNFKGALENICDNIQSGNSLSDAFSQYPKMFDRLYVNMVKAGEAGGVLDTVLDRLATFQEKAVRIKKKVKSAMVYPVVVLCIAGIIVYVLLTFVVPSFQQMLMSQGGEMPALTQAVMDVGTALREHFLVTIITVVVVVFVIRMLFKSPKVCALRDRVMFKMPKIGTFLQIVAVSRFSRTFGTLMSSGVPILQAMKITTETLNNVVLQEALEKVHDRVRDGDTLAAPLEQTKVFPAMVCSMVQVGEETGQLPEMLNRVADNYDEEVDNAVGALTSIIEPLLIVFLAVVVGTIVIAMFMPIIAVIQKMTGA